MKNNIIPFDYGDNLIRVINDETTEEPLWVAKDVCDVLGYKEVSKTLSKLDDDEKGTKKIRTLGGEQDMLVINESGLYTLIIRSNKPEAKPFKRWVTHDVLPSIRKTGSYSVEQNTGFTPAMEMLKKMMDAIVANSNAILELATAIKENIEWTKKATFENAMNIYSIDEQLNRKNVEDTLSTDMLDAIKVEVANKAKYLGLRHDIDLDDARRLIYSKLNSEFGVSTYHKIPYIAYDKAIFFIQNLKLSKKALVAAFQTSVKF